MSRIIFTISNNLIYDQRMNRIAATLSRSGHEVMLIGRNYQKNDKTLNNNNIYSKTSYKQKLISCVFNKSALFYAEYNIRLFFFLLFHRFDIVCAVDTDTLAACTLVSIIRKKSLFFDSHELFTEVPELENRNFIKKCWHLIEKQCIPKAEICYTVNISISEILSEKYHKKFEIIRNLPYLNSDFIDMNKKGEYLIYQGAVNKGRGLEELILAMHQIDMPLIIAGNGDLFIQLKNFSEANELNQKISFEGYMLPHDLKSATKNAFAGYNLLNQNSKNYYYSLSNKFFDYMQAAIPSLSNPFPEYKSIIEKFQVGILLETQTEAIVKTITVLRQNDDFYFQLRENNIKAREIFCWEKESKKLLKLYEKH